MENFIDQEKCKKCRLCIEVCPVNIIGIDDNSSVNFIKERESICLECGQCMAVCSTGAVKIAKYSYEENLIKLPDNDVDYQRYMNFIATRRSVRNFKNKAVESSLIEKVLSSLDYAPYGAAPQKVEITIINKREKIEEILPLTEKFLDNIVKWIDNFISRIIKRKKGVETFNTIKNHLYPMSKMENYKLKYGDRITRGAQALMVFHAKVSSEEHTNNSLIYATYVMLAMHSAGLGATMNGIIPAAINKDEKIREMFRIPAEHQAVISIMFGYPKYKYSRTVRRQEKIRHWLN